MKKVFTILSGVGIGAALMYLFDTKSGKQIRTAIHGAGSNLNHHAKKIIKQIPKAVSTRARLGLKGREIIELDKTIENSEDINSTIKMNRYARYVKHIARALASTEHPLLVHIVPMRRCNLSCAYCNEYDKTSEPVPIKTMLEQIDRLAELGSSIITISGGEPMMHPEIYDIIARIRHHGMIAGLISNGTYFQPEKIKKLNEAGLDELQISIDNVESDDVSKKSLKVLDAKLINLKKYAKFKININSVLGSGVANPEDALTIAKRARALGFASTVGIIHDHDGLNKGLSERDKEVYKAIKQLPQTSYAIFNGFQDELAEGKELEWRCRAGARYLYVDEAGIVSWCSQQRGTPGISLMKYTKEDIKREYITEKWCAPTCTIQCVHIISQVDEGRDPQISMSAYNNIISKKVLKKDTINKILQGE